jgi:hypothetical protein
MRLTGVVNTSHERCTEGFRVNAKIRKKLAQGKRRIERRLDKNDNTGRERPMLAGANIQYEIADRTNGVAAGGIGAMHLVAKKLGLAGAIDRRLHLLKVHLPYHESDHVLSIAYNLLAGGSRLEHLELRRNDEVFLDALGARRIPDPTTADDFCRRFAAHDIDALQEAFNEIRLKVWGQQPKAFFDEAIIEADGTMVETTGECKQGIDINHKGQWGYHPHHQRRRGAGRTDCVRGERSVQSRERDSAAQKRRPLADRAPSTTSRAIGLIWSWPAWPGASKPGRRCCCLRTIAGKKNDVRKSGRC